MAKDTGVTLSAKEIFFYLDSWKPRALLALHTNGLWMLPGGKTEPSEGIVGKIFLEDIQNHEFDHFLVLILKYRTLLRENGEEFGEEFNTEDVKSKVYKSKLLTKIPWMHGSKLRIDYIFPVHLGNRPNVYIKPSSEMVDYAWADPQDIAYLNVPDNTSRALAFFYSSLRHLSVL